MSLRPAGVLILAKNPQVACRLLFFGWYVLFTLDPHFLKIGPHYKSVLSLCQVAKAAPKNGDRTSRKPS